MPMKPPRFGPPPRTTGWVPDRIRGNRHARGYGNDWVAFRDSYIARHPLCVDPLGRHVGIVTPAEHVDHIVPLARGGERLSESNVRAVCKACHLAVTARGNRT